MKNSVLTIYSGRHNHLRRQLKGLTRSNKLPDEWVIVAMGETPQEFSDTPFAVKSVQIDVPSEGLPLAAARNRAAAEAGGENLIFLDVDCIPSTGMVATFGRMIKSGQLLMGTVGYLPPDATVGDWTIADLESLARDHPKQPRLHPGERKMSNHYELFWSLCFGISQESFARIGGFDERYVGYGAEDTDFAYRAREIDIAFGFVGARAFHQHHETCSPPLEHLQSIVRNAKLFRETWGQWPMRAWLDEFAKMQLVAFDADRDRLELLRLPDDQEVAASRK